MATSLRGSDSEKNGISYCWLAELKLWVPSFFSLSTHSPSIFLYLTWQGMATFKTKLKTYLFWHSQWLSKTTWHCCDVFAISAPRYNWLYLLTYLLPFLSPLSLPSFLFFPFSFFGSPTPWSRLGDQIEVVKLQLFKGLGHRTAVIVFLESFFICGNEFEGIW